MNSSNRTAVVLGSLIVLLLAIGGFVVLGDSGGDPGDTDVAGDSSETPTDAGEPTASPSEIASDATTGGANGGAETPSPSPSEVGGDATTGGAGGGGLPTESTDGESGGDEDPTVGGSDGDGDGTDGTGGDPGTDGSDNDTDDDRDVAGDFEADATDATDDGDLPETGATAVLPGLLLLGAGLAIRPLRPRR